MSEKKETISASPKVRKFARELGANLHLIDGSQREGRVTEDDVRVFVNKSFSVIINYLHDFSILIFDSFNLFFI